MLGLRAVIVSGDSMLPVLRQGDCLLVRVTGEARVGDVVVARHPQDSGLLLVKRAVGHTDAGWWLLSDNAVEGLDDSRHFGAVPDDALIGRVVCRYFPWRGRFRISSTGPA